MNAAFPFATSFGRRAADFFRRQAEQAAAAGMVPPQQQQPKNPPASRRAIRQLPTILVTPEDLVDPNNRECCICLEETHLRAHMMRLPCAHIFHPSCVVDWLVKSNTCPVCRYELPTDDERYEILRKEKMKHRKPRFAQYELERMSIRELKSLSSRFNVSVSDCTEKGEIIARLVSSGRVDLVSAPQPVEYPLSLLRTMKIGELKRCMADAGVFFDPIDVVEKEDMVQIFIASGRLVILAEEASDAAMQEDSDDAYVFVAGTNTVQGDMEKKPSAFKDTATGVARTGVPLVTTVGEGDSDDDDVVERHEEELLPQSNPLMEEVDSSDLAATAATMPRESDQDDAGESVPSSNPVENDPIGKAGSNDDDVMDGIEVEPTNDESTVEQVDQDLRSTSDHGETMRRAEENEAAVEQDTDMQDDESEEDVEVVYPRIVGRHASNGSEDAVLVDEYASAASDNMEDSRFHERSILDLQALARQMHVDTSDCLERHEIIGRLVSASGRSDSRLVPNDFVTWSVSELRALAREVDVDLSNCSDRDTMIVMLLESANERPRLADYLGALMPLAHLTVSQLRAVGREWHVNLSDCIEKEEMIHRLVIAGGPSSS